METKPAKLVKLDDFERKPNLLNVKVDLVIGIVGKIGELKYANEGNVNEDKPVMVPIRDLQIYDDTFTMVRLILRYNLAENSKSYRVSDILSIRNVKIQKVQNRFVMVTIKETVINVNTKSFEALWLKQWYLHNQEDIMKNNFTQFNNLSNTPAQVKKERDRDVSVTQPEVEGPPAKSARLSPSCRKKLHETNESANDNSKTETPAPLSSPASPTSSPMELQYDFTNGSTSSSPKPHSSTMNEFIEVIHDDDKDIKPKIHKENEEENQGNPEKEKEEADRVMTQSSASSQTGEKENKPDNNIKTDIRAETYHNLMHSPILRNVWDEEKDQYLINFITKYSSDLQDDSIYRKLLNEKPEVFVKSTPVTLKERVHRLSHVKNYLYLMKLCGGDHLETEEEKSVFIIRVEKLRESMKLVKPLGA